MPYTQVSRAQFRGPVTPVKDLTGQVFERLTVISRDGSNRWGQAAWLCRCRCGSLCTLGGAQLRTGNTKSCGCLKRDNPKKGTHLNSRKGKWSPEYHVWAAMRQRCSNPKSSNYPRYGGRGIRVCARWDSFPAFLSDMGPRPFGATLERINNSLNYCPSNCRWATSLEQARNTRKNRNVTALGKTQCVAAWAQELDVTVMRIHRWLNKGLDLDSFIRRLNCHIPK